MTGISAIASLTMTKVRPQIAAIPTRPSSGRGSRCPSASGGPPGAGAPARTCAPPSLRRDALLFDLLEQRDGTPEVGDHDRTADHEPDGEDLEELVVGDPLPGTLDHVVGDAIVAAEDQRRHEAQHLLDLGAQRAVFVGAPVQVEE